MEGGRSKGYNWNRKGYQRDTGYHPMSTRIAILGHSNVPRSLEITNATVRIFRKSGARACRFTTYPEFSGIWDFRPHITFLFLGSNDIIENCSSHVITNLTLNIAEDIETRTGGIVCILQIEPRIDLTERHINAAGYKRVAKRANKRISRAWRTREYLEWGGFLRRLFDRTGYHFNELGKNYIKERITHRAETIMSRWNRD